MWWLLDRGLFARNLGGLGAGSGRAKREREGGRVSFGASKGRREEERREERRKKKAWTNRFPSRLREGYEEERNVTTVDGSGVGDVELGREQQESAVSV